MQNHDDPLVVDPVGGTLTIERERVTVSYERLGKKHQIVYAVLGPP